MDKEYDIIELPIGRIIIFRDENIKKYFKLNDDNTFGELTEEELKSINNIFQNNNSSVYYSERLIQITKNNPAFQENYAYLMNFFNYIEGIIPEGCADNFYRNLSTLDINLNFNNFLDSSTENMEFYTSSGGYDTIKNSLTMDPISLKRILEISKKTKNPDEYFWRDVNRIILHEFLHMASTSYDPKTQIARCGFDTFPNIDESGGEIPSNRGLTEGMTEAISMAGVPGTVEQSSVYYIEALLVNQLSQLIGTDTMLISYFKASGIDSMKEQLDKIIPNDKNKSMILFQRIEDNFNLRKESFKQSILANVQNSLIEYFEEKVKSDIKNNPDIKLEELQATIQNFERVLVTPQRIEMMHKKPDNYIGLTACMEKFAESKKTLTEMIGVNIGTTGEQRSKSK